VPCLGVGQGKDIGSLAPARLQPTLAPKHLPVEKVDRLLDQPRADTPTGVQDPALFLNRSGERFSVRGVALLVNRYLRRIGVTDRSGPHLLRHTFATHALQARPNLRAVQELLGHSSVTTTQRYTHMEADDLRQQVAEMPGNRRSP